MKWFALTVRPRHEKTVTAQLNAASIHAYSPLYPSRRIWADRARIIELPLFPGYIFSRFDVERLNLILGIPSVLSVVGFGGKPTPLDDKEIAVMKAMLGCGMPVGPWPLLRVGQRVRVCSGPLTNLEGILVSEKSGFRVVVNMELLNRAVSVEIHRDFVEVLRLECNSDPRVKPPVAVPRMVELAAGTSHTGAGTLRARC